MMTTKLTQRSGKSPKTSSVAAKKLMPSAHVFAAATGTSKGVPSKDLAPSLSGGDVFESSSVLAALTLLKAVAVYAAGIFLISVLPTALVPIGWALTGIAMSWFFVVGTDCKNRIFFRSGVLNDFIGMASFLLLLRPYNKGAGTTAKTNSSSSTATVEGSSSLVGRAMRHFRTSHFSTKMSWLVAVAPVSIFIAVFFPLLASATGLAGILKFWLIPFLDYHIRIGTFGVNKLYRDATSYVILFPEAVVSRHLDVKWIRQLTAKVPSYKTRKFHHMLETSTPQTSTDDSPAQPSQSKSTSFFEVAKMRVTDCLHTETTVTSWMWSFVYCMFRWMGREVFCSKRADLVIFTPLFLRLVFPDTFVWIQASIRVASNAIIPSPDDLSFTLLICVSIHALILSMAYNYSKNALLEDGAAKPRPKHVLKNINWLHTIILSAIPSLAVYGGMTTPAHFNTIVWSIVYYAITGLGITAGYHRLFAHRAYEGNVIFRVFMVLAGAGAMQGSVRWWARDHRAHHRYTDTDKDPYSAPKGFMYAHIGWMLIKQKPNKIGRADISDLNKDPVIRWQHRHYLLIALTCAFVLPTIVAGLCWGDYRGGFFFAGVARLLFVHHSTFFVNSLAHYWGDKPFADEHTPSDSFLTAILTLGEGYHNFHHEFPQDYRNAIRWFQYDPTKWLIWLLSLVGFTYDLQRFPENEIKKGQVQMQVKNLAKKAQRVDWGSPVEDLPVMTQEKVELDVNVGRALVIVDGIVHDVGSFIDHHPGGRAILRFELGKDATDKFHGGVYKHSNGARNLLSQFRVAKLAGSEVKDKQKPQALLH